MKFKKVKTEHTILKDFYGFLKEIEQLEAIKRIIPGRIRRKQSGSSGLRVNFSYTTRSGLKYLLIKGSTAQELFIICRGGSFEDVKSIIDQALKKYFP